MEFYSAIRKLALQSGFTLKQQPNGEMDLNPYVYEFAKALLGGHDKTDMEVKVGALIKVTDTDEVDRIFNGASVGNTGVIVKLGVAGYCTVYLNESGKVVVLRAPQFKVEG